MARCLQRASSGCEPGASVVGFAVASVLQDDIDLAIRFGVPADSTMVAKRMAPNRRVLCASPAYLEAFGMPVDVHALEAHRFVLLSAAAGIVNEWCFTRNNETVAFCASVNRARNE